MPQPRAEPGKLSALLRELVRAPEDSAGTAWEHALRPGAVVGRFELLREIGHGGFGVVWEAKDRDLGRSVAFKLVLARGGPDVLEERVLSEAEAAAKLSHPNIVTLFDVGRSEHGPYLVLELLRGQTLARRLDQGPLAVGEALRIGTEVAKGLAHAHAHGVVHRDLTPGNVFLCDDGQVKVLDLGMAHAFGHRRLEGGTPGYMAPEQRTGAPEDERTDVFALGVILYRMLAGELPWEADRAASNRPAPALDVPDAPELGHLVARMLELAPVMRPRDAGEVLAPLGAFQKALERSPSGATVVRRLKRWGRRQDLIALTAAVVLLVAGTALALRMARERRTGASIAVLPFADLSPQHDQEYFADGIAEEILLALAHVDGLRVPGRTSSFYFKGKNARLADIGRELDVETVLEGSIRKEGTRIRVAAHVVSVADGHHIWSSTFDRGMTSVFEVQDEIARDVVASLKLKLLPGNVPTTRSHATSNPEVYRLFLLGRQFYTRYSHENFRRAVKAYEDALALDQGYAPAWAALAVPLDFLSYDAETTEAAQALRTRALEAAEKAVALSPNLADALSSRGLLRASYKKDWSGAEADLERAVLLHPADPDSRRRYAILLGGSGFGRLNEAIAAAKKAVDLDPLSAASWGQLGWEQIYAGQYERAAAAFSRAVEVSPEAQLPRFGLGQALVLLGRADEALAVFDRSPDEGDRLWGHAIAQHTLGHTSASDSALDAFINKRAQTRARDIAEVHAWRGSTDLALQWLERAFSQGPVSPEIRFDPFLRDLREDSRFQALVKRATLPDR